MQIVINWAAVAVAMLVGVFLNALWYSKPLFGPLWQRLSGLEGQDLKVGFFPRLALAFVASFGSACCLAGAFNFTHSNDFLQDSLAGLQLFLGLVAPAMAVEHVFSHRPLKLLAINLGPSALVLILQGGLLAAWK